MDADYRILPFFSYDLWVLQVQEHKREEEMAAQSQGIRQLMAAEKEAATTVTNARKSKLYLRSLEFEIKRDIHSRIHKIQC